MGNTESSGGASTLSMCCNNAYVNKHHELIAPEYNTAHRVKQQPRQIKNHEIDEENTFRDKENIQYVDGGNEQIKL